MSEDEYLLMIDEIEVKVKNASADLANFETMLSELKVNIQFAKTAIQNNKKTLDFCKNGAKVVNLTSYRKTLKELNDNMNKLNIVQDKERLVRKKLDAGNHFLSVLNEKLAAVRRPALPGKLIKNDFRRDKGTSK